MERVVLFDLLNSFFLLYFGLLISNRLLTYWGRSRFGRLHVEALQDTFDVVDLGQHVGSSTYCLDLPNDVEIHPIFHVSRLKELLGSGDNIITI